MALKKAKLFLKSKTIWLNLAGIAVIVLQLVLDTNVIVDVDLQAIALAILNLLVRFRTNEPIRLR